MISLFGIKHVKRLACLVLASVLTFETLCLFVGGQRAKKKLRNSLGKLTLVNKEVIFMFTKDLGFICETGYQMGSLR